jgi:hypothetical protein
MSAFRGFMDVDRMFAIRQSLHKHRNFHFLDAFFSEPFLQSRSSLNIGIGTTGHFGRGFLNSLVEKSLGIRLRVTESHHRKADNEPPNRNEDFMTHLPGKKKEWSI